MQEGFAPVYMASTVAVAQKLADRLSNAGIETFVDDTESPMYGMSLGPQSKVVHVRAMAEKRAREIIQDFQKQYDPPMPEDWQGEETGFELPKPQRPSDDSPNEPYNPGTEKLAGSAEPDNPEMAHMRDESNRRIGVSHNEVEAVGADRSPLDMPDAESPEVEEQPMEDLDVTEQLDVDEMRRPTAARPPKRKRK